MTRYRFVVALTAAVDASGTEQTFYAATTGFTTRPTDTPANTAIGPYLLNPGNYERSLFTGQRTFGAVSSNYGEVVLANHAGQFDELIDYGLDGRQFRLYFGDESAAFPSGYTLVLQCTMLSAEFGLDVVRIKLRDRLTLLDKPVLTQTFAGTGGVEGSSDMSGAPKPRLFGDTWFIPLVLLDRALNLYYAHTPAPLLPLFQPMVFDGGVELYRDSNYSSVSDMIGTAPEEGSYRCYTDGPTYVRLGSTPAYTVFANSNGGIFSFQDAAIEAGISDAGSGAGTVVNCYVDSASTRWIDVLNEQATSQRITFGFNRLDQWQSLQFAAPSGSPVYTFDRHNCLSIVRRAPESSPLPAYRVHAVSGRVWINRPVLAPAASLDAYPWMARNYRTDLAASNGMQIKHRLAESVEITSVPDMTQPSVDDFLTLFGTRRDQVTVEARFDPALLTLDLNSVVSVQWPRFGYDAGKLFRVIAQRVDFSTNRLQFTLWG